MPLDAYLIYGEDEVRMLEEKGQLIARLLQAEYLAENLSELEPPLNRPLELKSCVGELLAELGTMSFFPESRRLVIVYNLHDFYSAGERAKPKKAPRKKKRGETKAPALTPMQLLIRFLDRELASTGNAIIFHLVESFAKRRTLSKANPLYKLLTKKGRVIECKAPAANFQFTDALLARDPSATLTHFRKIVEAERGAYGIFNLLQRQVRFLIQAKLLSKGGEPDAFADQFLPAVKGLNLTKEHPFVQRKVMTAAHAFKLAELNKALRRLFELNLALYPTSEDVHVPDVKLQLELLLLELCGRQ